MARLFQSIVVQHHVQNVYQKMVVLNGNQQETKNKMSYDKLYFWCSRENKRLRFGDERLAKTGITHSVKGELSLCSNGLHASEKVLDALTLVPENYLWLVSLSDEKIMGKDQVCARSRTYIAGFNATQMIESFARKQAMINVERIKPFCASYYYDLVVDWLQTGKEELRSKVRKASNFISFSTVNSIKGKPAFSAACAIRYATISEDVDLGGLLTAIANIKGHSKPYSEDYEQANKVLMEMLPDRIKTILAQHEL